MSDFFSSFTDELFNEKENNLDIEETVIKTFAESTYDKNNIFSNDVNDFIKTGWINNFNLDMVLSIGIFYGASDIHISGGQEVCYSVLGSIKRYSDIVNKYNDIVDEDLSEMLSNSILNYQEQSLYIKDLQYDTSYTIKHGVYSGTRLRVNLCKSVILISD